MDKESKGSAYLRPTFPKTGEANMKEGIFDGPQITSIRRKKTFIQHYILNKE
jgi:hypothetical protein